MKHSILKYMVVSAALLGAMQLNSSINTANTVQASSYKYAKKFYRVKVIKETMMYSIKKGSRFAKQYYLEPGDIIYVKNNKNNGWGWTIGKKGKSCSKRSSKNHSWFTTKVKAKKNSNVPSKKAVKAYFFKDGSTYTYYDSKVEIYFSEYQLGYHQEGNYISLNLIVTNRSKHNIQASDSIFSVLSAHAPSSGKYLNIKSIDQDSTIKPKHHINYRIRIDDYGQKNILFKFVEPHTSKVIGSCTVYPEKDNSETSNRNSYTNSNEKTVTASNSGTLSEWNNVQSLQGKAKEDAERQMMSNMGLIQHGNQLVSSSEFERQMNDINNGAQNIMNHMGL